jgi:hypothetical protein
MSSEATTLTVAAPKRNTNPAQYWTFFPKEDLAFWNFGDRSRENVQTQPPPPQRQPSFTNASRSAEERRALTPPHGKP